MADRVDQVVAAVPVPAARLLEDRAAACGHALPTPTRLRCSPRRSRRPAPFAARTRALRRAPLRNAAHAAAA